MLSAISFGVFCRSAPSTSAIMRSRNVWPGSAVTLTLIQSDSTRVPPVTAERSPPASRMTGADSPVMADSSTEATPSTISPSDGMNSPAVTSTTSPLRSDAAGTDSVWPYEPMRLATVSVRAFRSVSACALPRPSAIASARFANSTVAQSHERDLQLEADAAGAGRDDPAPAAPSSATAPTSTTNMTGFLTITPRIELAQRVDDAGAH